MNEQPTPVASIVLPALTINLSDGDLSQFMELIRRGINLWPDASANTKALADLITAGVVMQDYWSLQSETPPNPMPPLFAQTVADKIAGMEDSPTVAPPQTKEKAMSSAPNKNLAMILPLELAQVVMPIDINWTDALGNKRRSSYGEYVARQMVDLGTHTSNLMHAGIGMAGESGEILDALKKHYAYGRPLNEENMIEELGDMLFYFTAMCMLMGCTVDYVAAKNYEKLLKRYPSGAFSEEEAIARADKA